MVQSIEWLGDRVRFIDQSGLPLAEQYIETRNVAEIADAIRSLKIRGAPLIGIAAAYGVALAALEYAGKDPGTFNEFITRTSRLLLSTRPTAVNLRWALDRMVNSVHSLTSIGDAKKILVEEALVIHREDAEMCRRIGEHGASLLADGAVVLTHCNAGALATGGEGTALSVITAAVRHGKSITVFAGETRPLLQGARLTVWELMKSGVDVTLITDSTAASLMGAGRIACVLTGADRIAANGDSANKIGTYGLAVAARHHDIPMYIAAPGSTIDPTIPDGAGIPIEERNPDEVTTIAGHRLAPEGARVYSPAFDVTPARLISAIVTERGIHRGPYVFTKEMTGRLHVNASP